MSKRVSVVVRISEHGESPRNAIKTILENAATISDVHLVQLAYDPTAIVYEDWHDDCTALDKLELTPLWHNVLDESKLQSLAVVTLLADHEVTQGTWKTLLEETLPFDRIDRKRSCRRCGTRPTHFAVNTALLLDVDAGLQTTTPQAMWYGFLLVIGMLDALRALVSGGHYHGGNTVRAQYVSHVYHKIIYMPPYPRWSMWFSWLTSPVAPVSDYDGGSSRIPDARGLPLVLRIIRTHPHMGWGLQWFCGYALYYALFVAAAWRVYRWDPTFGYYWVFAHLIHASLVAYATNTTYAFPRNVYGFQVMVLYPVYLALSPLMFVYARYHRPVTAARHRK